MTNLTKLKKKGKTVGYLEIARSAVWFLHSKTYVPLTNDNISALTNYIDNKWMIYDYVECPDFDESLPYVCTDKNGKKVFAGDETNHGVVVWNTILFTWTLLENIPDVLGDNEMIGVTNRLSDYIADIELIKDKDNG